MEQAIVFVEVELDQHLIVLQLGVRQLLAREQGDLITAQIVEVTRPHDQGSE